MKQIMRGMALVFVGSALMLTGCGEQGAKKLVSAGGVVKFNGAPVEGASVTLVYENGDAATGISDKEGKFALTTAGRNGAPVGKAKVSVAKRSSELSMNDNPNPKPEDMMKAMQDRMKNQDISKKPKSENELPAKYEKADTSGLTAEIPSGGVTDLLFDLK